MAVTLLNQAVAIRALRRAILFALLIVIVVPAMAQEPQRASPPDQPPAATADAPSGQPGLFNELGKLLKAPIDMLPSLHQPAPDPPPTATPEARADPAAPAAALPTAPAQPAAPAQAQPGSGLFPGIVSGREICVRSANGAPDCKSGAEKLCQSKGYKSGNSLSTDSAYGCSTKPLRAALAGRREGKLCGTENYVTRAFCQ